MKTVATVDFVVVALYMALMLGIGIFAMRLNRGVTDYFRGGSRVHWLAAGLSSFMSGFSAWTFTGAAGLAYQHGLVAVLLYVGNAATFLLGYWIFAVRWRRARLTTVMEYLAERYDERTRQAFAWTTIFFQLFTGAGMLYGLAIFVAPACGWPISWTVVASGAIILAYTVIGGLWAVVITDFLQAAILMPFTLLLAVVALVRLGGPGVLLASLPEAMTSWRLPDPQFSWTYVLLWSVMTSFGYNTSAMAQRYFSVEDERAARKVALLCFVLFLVGSGIWFVPAMAMRVTYPTLAFVWPGLSNPQESVYALAAVTLLPNGLIGIMLAAIFSATMSSISGLLNVHAAVISKDIVPALFPRRPRDPVARQRVAGHARRRRDHDGDCHRDGRAGAERLHRLHHLQYRDVARLWAAGAARARHVTGAELGRPAHVRGRPRARLLRRLRGHAGVGTRALGRRRRDRVLPAVHGDDARAGCGFARSDRVAPDVRAAAPDAGGRRGGTRRVRGSDGRDLPLPEPGHRRHRRGRARAHRLRRRQRPLDGRGLRRADDRARAGAVAGREGGGGHGAQGRSHSSRCAATNASSFRCGYARDRRGRSPRAGRG